MSPLETLNLADRAGHERPRRFVQTPGGPELSYAEVGDGSEVVLIHGVLTALDDMALALFDALRDRHRVIAFDRPGFGRSQRRRFLDAGVFAQAERLWEGLDALAVRRPVLVGHSFGGSVALAMALTRPERTAGVVALAPLVFPEPRLEHLVFAPRAPPVAGDLVAMASATSDKSVLSLLWRAMFLPQAIPDRVLDGFPFAMAGESVSTLRVGEDALAALPDLMRLSVGWRSCPTPVRVFAGDRDLVVRNGVHGRMLAAFAPDGDFHDLPGLGHMIHHFAADSIARAVDDLCTEPAIERVARDGPIRDSKQPAPLL
jgi:pimeloyl-ACP methyl ester carboxylesterase